MKKFYASLMVLMAASAAFGIYDPSWERPILAAEDMVIDNAEFGFKDVSRADLALTQRDGEKQPTGIIATLTEQGHVRSVTLKITNISQDKCGTTEYSASYGDPMGARFNVFLADHSLRKCKDLKKYRWEASVREGFGWCGTGDSSMDLSGNPHPVITILNR